MNNVNLNHLSYVNDETKEKLMTMLDVFQPEEGLEENPQEMLMKVMTGGGASCHKMTMNLINIIKMVDFQLLVISNLLVNLFDMEKCDLDSPFRIESTKENGEIYYNFVCNPIFFGEVSEFILEKCNTPLIINTHTGVFLKQLINSEDSVENCLKIDDLRSAMSFLYKNLCEIQVMLMKYAENAA